MNLYRKTLSLLLAASLVFGGAPFVHARAQAASCCKTQTEASSSADCCQREAVQVQMRCCSGSAVPGVLRALPAAKVTEKNLRPQLDVLTEVLQLPLVPRSSRERAVFTAFNLHLNDNHRYLLTTVFLL